MSRSVATLVYSRRIGSMARKAVLAYCADRANDDGTGVWASKQTISEEVECSRQTVITTMRELVNDGLLIEVGRRKCQNGFTTEYSIALAAVQALPKVDEEQRQDVQNLTGPDLDPSTGLTARRQAALPKPSLNRPMPKKDKPSLGKRAQKPATPFPETFMPVLSGKTAAVVDGWPPGRLDDELEHFADHHTAKGSVSHDWQASFRTWVRNSRKWEPRHGQQRQPNGLRGTRADPALDMWLQANADLEAERGNPPPDFGSRIALPSSRPS